MDMATLQAFFMWCMILNGGILILSFLITLIARDFVYKMHSKWFPMPRETFNTVIYSFFGIFKMAWLLLNVMPFIALRIIG